MNLKIKCLLLIAFCHLIVQIRGDCEFLTVKDPSIKPIFLDSFLTFTSVINDTNDVIHFDSGERIVGYCKNEFAWNNLGSKITLDCEIDNRIYNLEGHFYLPSKPRLACSPDTTFGTCDITLHSDTTIRPKMFTNFGSRQVHLVPSGNIIKIGYNQKITAQCNTKFKSPNHDEQELELICIQGRMVAIGYPFDKDYSKSLECKQDEWNLYEPTEAFPWCSSSMASYIAAQPRAYNRYDYFAGICYDFNQMSVKSIYYAPKTKYARHLPPRVLKVFDIANTKLSDIDRIFISKKTHNYGNYDNPYMMEWVNFSNYINGYIVPNLYNALVPFDLLRKFDQLLTIDWWSGLKQGNWKHYENALSKHLFNDNKNYDILAGVSQVVAVPIKKEICSKNITMVDVIDSENCTLPLYVWNYLSSLNNSNENVVVIGVNTPFYDFYDEKELLFCNDICHTIDWLKDVHMTFRYRTMGIIICCTVEEVLASDRLDGFAIPTEWSETTMKPEIYETTEVREDPN